MPITSSAKKSLRVAVRRASENARLKLRVKNQIKNASTESLTASYSILDKAAKNSIIHPNKAARLKSRLAKRLAQSEVTETAPKTTARVTKKAATTTKRRKKKSA